MKISRIGLASYSERFCDILDRERIFKIEDLRNFLGKELVVGKDVLDLLFISRRPSNFGTTCYDLFYKVRSTGIIISAKLNKEFDNSQVILKFQGLLLGYNSFAKDVFGNIAQSNFIDSANLEEVRKELELLRKLR